MGSKKLNMAWLIKMAWRDGRAGYRHLLLFVSSLILGVAAVVMVNSFGANLDSNIADQSKILMGADFKVDSNHPANSRVWEIMDSLGGPVARSIGFPSMAKFLGGGETKLVAVKGFEGEFPLYGTIDTEPETASINYREEKGALVDATLMFQFGLSIGDSVSIGDVRLPISGKLHNLPGASGFTASIAPPVIIPYELIDKTGLVQVGSRIDYDYYFRAQEDQNLEVLDEMVDLILDAENADLDTHESTGRRLGRRYNNFGKFLNLIAFISLILGCVGIASSVHVYIKEKLKQVAILKCLGASRKEAFYIYLFQIAATGLLGSVVGSVIGVTLQYVFPLLLEGIFPFEMEINFSAEPIFIGILLGLMMSVLFALTPLVSTYFISPLQVLRVQQMSSPKSERLVYIVGVAIFLFLLGFAYWLLQNFELSLYFLVGLVAVFAIVSLSAALIMRVVKSWFSNQRKFTVKHAVLNLYRPNNQTLVLILTIGIASFLINTLYFTRDMLSAKADMQNSDQAANLILMDVQSDEKGEVSKFLQQKGFPIINSIPIVTMRVHEINDRLTDNIRKDSLSTINDWVLNHEFRATYRDSLIGSESIETGAWPVTYDASGLIPISLSDNVARDAEVEVGDPMTFNVQGVLMKTKVVAIRSVDWGRMQLNFNVVFPKRVLENAPQFHVLTSKVEDDQQSAKIQNALVEKFPTVSIIDLRQVISLLEDILSKINWVVNFMALFCILTGVIVLMGSVRTSKFQRIKESVLLRTLGAKGYHIKNITVIEYLVLGFLGSALGLLLSLAGSYLLGYFIFDLVLVPSLVPFLVVLPAITLMVLVIGLVNSLDVLNKTPLEVLRREMI